MDMIRHRAALVLTQHIDEMKDIVDHMRQEELRTQSEKAAEMVPVLENAIHEMAAIIQSLDP